MLARQTGGGLLMAKPCCGCAHCAARQTTVGLKYGNKTCQATSPMPQRWIIAYDIAEPKRLRSIAKHLEGVGTRLQYSVFECGPQAWQDGKLRQALCGHLEPGEDALSSYAQCAACREKSVWQGKSETPQRQPASAAAQKTRAMRLSPPAYWLI